MRSMKPLADRVDGMHFQPLGQTRIVADAPPKPCPEGVGQNLTEGREKDPRVGIYARKMDRAVHCHDGLSGPRRTGNASGPGATALDELP
jgi:hypothetical protein